MPFFFHSPLSLSKKKNPFLFPLLASFFWLCLKQEYLFPSRFTFLLSSHVPHHARHAPYTHTHILYCTVLYMGVCIYIASLPIPFQSEPKKEKKESL